MTRMKYERFGGQFPVRLGRKIEKTRNFGDRKEESVNKNPHNVCLYPLHVLK